MKSNNPVQIQCSSSTADALTPLQHAFVAEYVANGGNASKALRTVAAEGKPVDRMEASRMLRMPAVAARLAELRHRCRGPQHVRGGTGVASRRNCAGDGA